MLTPDFFEALMLIAFGVAWPASIYKSYTSRKNQGKSAAFLYIIFFGYICGITHEILHDSRLNYVLVLFVINSLMVAIDILLYHRNTYLASLTTKKINL